MIKYPLKNIFSLNDWQVFFDFGFYHNGNNRLGDLFLSVTLYLPPNGFKNGFCFQERDFFAK